MKRAVLALVAIALVPMAFAQSGGMKGMDMKMDKKDAESPVHKATGVVTKVDRNKVTIKHGPVPSMKWPAMAMAFTVKDKALMDKLAKGRKVDFEFEQQGREYVVTSVK
jgi:Cu(I)/Ag(I) efflux system protein CusF